MTGPFTIAHLSDPHLTASPDGRRTEPKFTGQLTGMNGAFRRVLESRAVQDSNLLLITGDITDKGEFAAWQRLDELLVGARMKSRTLVVAGNHDVCDLSARIGWPASLAREDLARLRRGLAKVGQPRRYPWARLVDPRVVVFGIDSNNAGNLTAATNAMGQISERQLTRFAELLARHREAPVKIVALHHSPNIPQRATAIRRGNPPKSLLDRWAHEIPAAERRAFRALCIAHRVRLVLHGHLHEAEDRRINGLRIVGAPSTTEPAGQPGGNPVHRFYRYRVLGNGGRVTRELVEV